MECPETITSVLTIAVSVLTFLWVYYQIKIYTYWSSRGIKGPIPVPFLGTNIYLFFKKRVDLDREWREKYGTTFGTYDGYMPTLQTSDKELIKHINIKHFSSFTDRNSTFVHSDEMKRWTFFSKGDYWSNQRALISPMFSGAKMRSTFNVMQIGIERFLKEVKTKHSVAAKELAGGEEKYEMMDEVDKTKALIRAAQELVTFSKDETMALSLDVIAKSFFSLNMDTYQDRSTEFYKRAFKFATFDVPYFIMWCFIPTFIARYLKMDPAPKSTIEYFDKLTKSMIKERRKNPRKTKQIDMLQNLMDAQIPDEHENIHNVADDNEAHYNDQMTVEELNDIQKDLEKKSTAFRKFSDEEIAGQSIFFFLAGFETTSSSLAFCIYELGHQQEAQEEVYDELVEAVGADGELDYNKLMELKKLEAFISESLRLYNPVTQNTRVVTAREGVILPTSPPLKLPQGFAIDFAGLICHREPEYWEDPLKFDMTRFYPENKHKIKSGTYHPFGAGPRNCVGMRFALLEIRLTLASLLLKYKVLPGFKSSKYPPEFNAHAFFLQFTHTDFRLIPRQSTTQIA